MEEIKKESERLIELFPVYDWNGKTGYEQNIEESKNMAIRCVDEIIKTEPCSPFFENNKPILGSDIMYWQEVKEYIKDNY